MQKKEQLLSLIIELNKHLEKLEVQIEFLLKEKAKHKCTITNSETTLTK